MEKEKTTAASSLSKHIPAGISRPAFGIGTVARNGLLDSKTRSTAGKNKELNSSILPTSSITKRSVSSLIWKSNQHQLPNALISHTVTMEYEQKIWRYTDWIKRYTATRNIF